MSTVIQTAATIASQARRLGCEVEGEVAGTGTHYLTLRHSAIGEDEDRLIRIADHEPNEARYIYRVNREPDLDVEAGFQAAAVERICKWIGLEPSSVPYLRGHATRVAKAEAHKATIAAARRDEWAAQREQHAAAVAALAPGDKAVFDHYSTLSGKARKNFRKSGAYRRLREALK